MSGFARLIAAVSATAFVLSGLASAQEATSRGERPLVIKAGKILTMDEDETVINNGVLIARGQTIERLGKASEIEIPKNATIIDMPTCWLAPGFVEAHNHEGGAGGDLHDYVYLTNPGLRTIEGVHTDEDAFNRARAGGVTTALVISGSGTNMSGHGTAVKFGEGNIEDVVAKYPASIKIAQAGNPERYWFGVGRSFMNYNLRQTLQKAKDYSETWRAYEAGEIEEKPRVDPLYEDFRPIFAGNAIASVHTQAYQVVMMTLLMVDAEMNMPTVLDHSTFDGYKTAPLVVEAGDVYTINGPRQFFFDRTQRRIFGNAHRWWKAGIPKLGVNTDSPVIPQEELSFQAAIACWYGWDPYKALEGITRISAESLKMEDQVGTLEPGKDADFCVWSGDPIDPRSTCWITVVNGEIVRDARDGVRHF